MGKYARWGDVRLRLIGPPVMVVKLENLIMSALREDGFEVDRFSDLFPLKGSKNTVRAYSQVRENCKEKKNKSKEHA